MKDFIAINNQAAQGDVLITSVSAIPDGFTKIAAAGGQHIITHSETGHHHVMAASSVDFYQAANDPLIAYIDVKIPAKMEHLRSFDTHKTLLFAPGMYRINRQAEESHEGWIRVAD